MPNYVKLTETPNRHTNWTSEFILEKDENGNVTKSVKVGEPVLLSAEKRKELEAKGYVFEDSSKAESNEVKTESVSQPVGGDVATAAPRFGDSGQSNQGTGSVKWRSRSEK